MIRGSRTKQRLAHDDLPGERSQNDAARGQAEVKQDTVARGAREVKETADDRSEDKERA